MTLSVWIEKYRWVFMGLTFLFLGIAALKIRRTQSLWNKLMFYGTTALSLGLIVYSLVFRT